MSMEEVDVKLWNSCLPKCDHDANTYRHKDDGAIRGGGHIHHDRQISSTVGYILICLIPPNAIERGVRGVDVGSF